MSNEAAGYVWRCSPFEGATLQVHHAVADSVNDQNNNEFWMDQGKLAAKARVSRATVNSSLQKLIAGGFLELLEEGGGRSKASRYRFLFPDVVVVFESRTHVPKTVNSDDSSSQTVKPATQTVKPATQTVKPLDRHRTQENPREPKLSLVQTDEESAMHQPSAEGRKQPGTEPWPAYLSEIPAELERIQAPPGFFDAAFWIRIDEWIGPHPTVGYMDELRRWVTWWYSMPPVKRRKAVQRSFTTWLRTEEAKANNSAERIRASGQKQARR